MTHCTPSESSFIQSYLHLASRNLTPQDLETHKNQFKETMNSKTLSKEALQKVIETLLTQEKAIDLDANERAINTILTACKKFTDRHCLKSSGLIIITDQEAVEEISEIMLDVLNLKPFKSGNTELALILSSFLLKKVNKPPLILKNTDDKDFQQAITDKLAMKIFVAGKYKESVMGDRGHILNVVQVYENASRYETEDGRGTLLVEWHGLNKAIQQWEKLAHQS